MPRRLDPRRSSLRLPGRDYSAPGLVFVTIDVANRQQLFGLIDDYDMHPSHAGCMVDEVWQRVPDAFASVALDEYVVMPDHTHAILAIGLAVAGDDKVATVGDVIRWFKATTVEAYRQGVLRLGWTPYDGKLWHRNFHDRILREGELEIRRRYIRANPQRRWERTLQDRDASTSIWRSVDWRTGHTDDDH